MSYIRSVSLSAAVAAAGLLAWPLVSLALLATATGVSAADAEPNEQQASPVPLAAAGQPLATKMLSLDPSFDRVIPADAQVIVLKGGNDFGITDGAAWVPEGQSGYLLFSDIVANVIYKWAPDTQKLSVFLTKSGYSGTLADVAHAGYITTTHYGLPLYVYDFGSNGIALDPQGHVVIVAQGDRNIVRLETDGTRTVLADRYGGKRFNRPNKLAIKSDGSIYFSDLRGPSSEKNQYELPYDEAVYRIKDGKVSLAIAEHGHGIAFSPDEKHLYITGINPPRAGGGPPGGYIMRYDVRADDTLTDGRMFMNMPGPGIPDGLTVDSEGNVYSGGPGGVWVINPQGKHIGTIPLPASCTNLVFGGPDLKTLYLLDSRNLLQIRVNVPGVPLPGRLSASARRD